MARTGICEETIRCGLTDEAAASNQTQEVKIVYRKVDTNLNFVDREKEVEKFWKDNKILCTIIDKFKGGPVGLTTIATALGEDAGTIEEVYEPFLIKEGFLKRTPRGREVTELAYIHLGRSIYNSQKTLFDD